MVDAIHELVNQSVQQKISRVVERLLDLINLSMNTKFEPADVYSKKISVQKVERAKTASVSSEKMRVSKSQKDDRLLYKKRVKTPLNFNNLPNLKVKVETSRERKSKDAYSSYYTTLKRMHPVKPLYPQSQSPNLKAR